MKEVVKQENAVTALQAIARAPSQVRSSVQHAAACHWEVIQIERSGGQRVRRQWRAGAMQKAQVESNVPPPQPKRVSRLCSPDLSALDSLTKKALTFEVGLDS